MIGLSLSTLHWPLIDDCSYSDTEELWYYDKREDVRPALGGAREARVMEFGPEEFSQPFHNHVAKSSRQFSYPIYSYSSVII